MHLPKNYLRKIWRAVMEFEMIFPHDKVMVGLSGGKDSMFLLYALKTMQKYSPFPFQLAAATIDLGYGNIEQDYLAEYCQRLEVPFYLEKTQIAQVVAKTSPDNPCSSCAFYRRGALATICKKKEYNLLALAHHQDDAIETFILSLFYSGQLKTFRPTSNLDRSGLRVIRPLVYFTEAEVKGALKYTDSKAVKNPCPYAGNTKREHVKTFLKELVKENPNVYTHLLSAMREGKKIELWPPKATKEEMQQRYKRFMGKIDKNEEQM